MEQNAHWTPSPSVRLIFLSPHKSTVLATHRTPFPSIFLSRFIFSRSAASTSDRERMNSRSAESRPSFPNSGACVPLVSGNQQLPSADATRKSRATRVWQLLSRFTGDAASRSPGAGWKTTGKKRPSRVVHHYGGPWSDRDHSTRYGRQTCIAVQPSFCIVDLSRWENEVPSLSVEDFRNGGRKKRGRRTREDFLWTNWWMKIKRYKLLKKTHLYGVIVGIKAVKRVHLQIVVAWSLFF